MAVAIHFLIATLIHYVIGVDQLGVTFVMTEIPIIEKVVRIFIFQARVLVIYR